ncbi:MAG: hypothetical protein IPP05_11380 [Cytophagaceae bacterium]|nr:hypothetical protein [Cytophagaceae bacterium]
MKKRTYTIAILFTGIIAVLACKTGKNPAQGIKKEEGLVLMEQNCYTCHSPNATESNRLAPPMIAVKKHYFTEKMSEEQFVNDLVSFVLNPTDEKSKMPGAKRRFNLMPKVEYSKSDVEKIAKYIYRNNIEQPEWFEEHYKKEMGNGNQMMEEDTSFLAKGKKLSMRAQQELGKNLMGALNKGGAVHAMNFCNDKAMFLTDSMANVLKVNVKRVSDKNRNPKNAANESEIAYIQLLKDNLKMGIEPKPGSKVIDGKKSRVLSNTDQSDVYALPRQRGRN